MRVRGWGMEKLWGGVKGEQKGGARLLWSRQRAAAAEGGGRLLGTAGWGWSDHLGVGMQAVPWEQAVEDAVGVMRRVAGVGVAALVWWRRE